MNISRIDGEIIRKIITGEFQAFSEYDLSKIFKKRRSEIEQSIESQNDDYILNVNREEYIQHLISTFSIKPLEIHKDDISMSCQDEMIPAEMHPPYHYYLKSGDSYKRDVYVFYIPFTGDSKLLRVRASSFSLHQNFITIEQGCICFRVINFNLDAEKIKQESDQIVKNIDDQNSRVTSDIRQFNASIQQHALSIFNARKEQLFEKKNLIASIDIPLRASNNKSATFSVPAKRTKAIVSKPTPQVTEKGYTPEPTLNTAIYEQILKIIHDMGKQFEKLPSTYSGKKEEDLRDHMLLILEPNFEGAATGETFNKYGKTDILLRYEGKNVFIAELKFWHGKKSFLKTISQLLGYLTWRDSKAAVVIFVRNKELMSVLNIVKECVPEHENYLVFEKEQDEGWYHYRFHINGDKNREVKLAVMLFHIP